MIDITDKLLRPVGPLQFDLVKDWTGSATYKLMIEHAGAGRANQIATRLGRSQPASRLV